MSDTPPPSARPARTPREPRRLYSLVVIGSSAGGIEALSTVLTTLPADFPVPIVVAQHLDPRQTSHLAEILAQRTPLMIHTIADHETLVPGVVYVVPADRNVEIRDGHLSLLTDSLPRPKPSINLLFSTAARAYGETLIAVILTGTGSDGAVGAREVKVLGGTVVIENPKTAAYPGMPASLAPTTVDLIADLPQIGPTLQGLLSGISVAAFPPPNAVDESDTREQSLQSLLALVQEQTGLDFSSYKRPTILRRLQRRVLATKSADLPRYAAYLNTHPEEYQRLAASFLIKVTEFFRDPELFEALRTQVLPELIAQARARSTLMRNVLRIWSAGCATGEEAYSLAILVAEALGDELERFQVQLFATDLDEEAITFARHGIYPPTALRGLSEEIIGRYFSRLDGNYEVTKLLRGLVVFGQHDLGQRPPFPHIDLVLCRNVLIYFTPELQTRALQLFAFALRDGGYLGLGKAETVHPFEPYFAPVAGPLKLFRRQGERVLGPIERFADLTDITEQQPLSRRLVPRRPVVTRAVREPLPAAAAPPRQLADTGVEVGARPRTNREWLGPLLLELPVGAVVVDRNYDVQAINRAALHLLGIYTMALGKDLIHLTQSSPAAALRAAIDATFAGQPEPKPPRREPPVPGTGHSSGAETVVTLETVLGERRHLHITCFPYTGATEREGALEPSATSAPNDPVPRPVEVAAVLLLIEDVTAAVLAQEQADADAARQRATATTEAAPKPSDRERALQRLEAEVARLAGELEQVSSANRALLNANQDLNDLVLEGQEANEQIRRTNEELLVGNEESQASAEEVKTLNEELQATNEELVTVNEELEATVEELHAANDDLEARGSELLHTSGTLNSQRSEAETKRAQLAAVLSSLADAVLFVDQTGAPLLMNAAYEALFDGASTPFVAEDAAGHPLSPAATPQQRAARGETFTMEFSRFAPDGTRRWYEASGQPIRGEGAGGGVVAIRDITERSLHRLQDEFVAMASHELRTPLTPLRVYLQQLSTLFADLPADSRQRHYIVQAQRQEQRLERLVQDLLDVRRLQQGGFQVERERVALDQVVGQAVEVAQAMVAGGRPPIRLERPDSPVVVLGDAMRLEQVLLNLLTNGVMYATQAHQIDVRLRQVGSEAELVVQDDGPGIPAADLPRLFSRFYQVARTDGERPSRRGLGLGLYIAHELVVAHGGRIEVTSVEAPARGHGTTFTIHLPLAPDAPAQQPPQTTPRRAK